MLYPSEYSLKSSRTNGSSSRTRFMALLRSIFRPASDKYPDVPRHLRSPHSRPASASLKRRKTEPPVRSSSQYEYLSEVQDQTLTNYQSNATLSGLQAAGNRTRPFLPASPSRTYNQGQYYTPQIKRANTGNFCVQSSGYQDIWIANSDPKPARIIRTISQYQPGDRYLCRNESRPIYSESVEVSISDALPHLHIQQPLIIQRHQKQYIPPPSVPQRLEKKVVSVANIPLECPHADPLSQTPNAKEKRIAIKTQYLDKFDQRAELPVDDEFRRRGEIKEKILAEWEQNWRRGEQMLDGSFSSLGMREEPSMVDDELKEIPSPSLRPSFSPHGGSEGSKTTDWEVDRVEEHFMKNDTIHGGESGKKAEMKVINRQTHDNQLLNENTNTKAQEGHSFPKHIDIIMADELDKSSTKNKKTHTAPLESYLNHNCNRVVNHYHPLCHGARIEGKRLHSLSTSSVPDEKSETEYEFYSAKQPILVYPQSAPLKRKSVDPRVIFHSNLQSKDISDNTASNFSIDNLFEESSIQLSPSEFINQLELEPQITNPSLTINMARLRQRNMGQDIPDHSDNALTISPSQLFVPTGHNSLRVSFKNDSIDMGETGRINYRTGSFLGRFTDRSVDRARNQNSEHCPTDSRNRGRQTLKDYVKSDQLDDSVAISTRNSTNQRSLTQDISIKRPVPKIPIGLSKPAELDPVLALLLSDVTQLDELRNNFREKSVKNRKSVKNSPSTVPHKDQNDGTSRSEERNTSLNEGITLTPIIKQEDVDDAHRELTSQIHDLIDIECISAAKKAGTMKKSAVDRSHKDQIPNEPHKDDKGISFLLVRQHQFRWSEKHQRPSPYSAMRPTPPLLLKEPEEVEESEIVPGFSGSTKPNDSIDQKAKPTSRIISMLIPHMQDGIPIWVFSAGQLNVLRRMAQTQITLTHEHVCPSNRLIKWRIGRGKGTHLKASTNVALQESPSDSQQELVQTPISIVLNRQTDTSQCDCKPSPLSSTLTSSESENSPIATKTPDSTNSESAFWPELKQNIGSSTDLVTMNSYGACRSFVGPLFGRTLAFWQRRVGYPFPPCICNMLVYLQQAEHAAQDIFRRAGGKLRTQALRERIEKDIYCNNFDEWQPYDVADLLKQFFRELPESILTNKLSTTLINIFHHAPEVCTINLLRLAMVSLPDENRIALQSFLHFLYALSLRCSLTRMSALNLAICLAPSLFHFSSSLGSSTPVSPLLANFGSRRRKKLDPLSGMDAKGLAEQVAAQKCLCALITFAPDIFLVTESIVLTTRLDNERIDIPRLSALLYSADGDPSIWLKQQVENLLRDCGSPFVSTNDTSGVGAVSTSNFAACTGTGSSNASSKNATRKSNWSVPPKEVLKLYSTDSGQGEKLTGFEISTSKVSKSVNQHYQPGSISPFIQTWRCSLLFPVEDPQLIADKYWNDRASWDENVLRSEVMEELIPQRVQIHRILFNALPPQPARECRLLRGRQVLLKSKNASLRVCTTGMAVKDAMVIGVAIVSTSVNYGVVVPEVPQELLPSAHYSKEHLLVERTIADSRLACRVTIISEADIKGFSQEWYASQWGHYLLRRLLALRHSFIQSMEFTQFPDSTTISLPPNPNPDLPSLSLPQTPAPISPVRTEVGSQEDLANEGPVHEGQLMTDI